MPQGLGNYNPVMEKGKKKKVQADALRSKKDTGRGAAELINKQHETKLFHFRCNSAPSPPPGAWDSPLPTQAETRETSKRPAHGPPATSFPFSLERT